MAGSTAKVTVHHLDYSRSSRILWFLEEIGLRYEVVHHQRLPNFRAPDSLRRIHPLGKAPVITDGDLVIAESGVILAYLDETYACGRFTPTDIHSRWRHAEWAAFAETTAAPALITCLYGKLVGGFTGIFATIVAREAKAALSHVENGVGDAYLFGGALTIADFQICYILELAKYLGLLTDYPNASAYLQRLNERPALQRALALGGAMAPPNPV